MNLRLSRNQLRFRITPAEMVALIAGDALTESLSLPGNSHIGYKIIPAIQDEPLSLGYHNHEIVLNLSFAALEELAGRVPSREGIENMWRDTDGNMIKLMLEVDVKKYRGSA